MKPNCEDCTCETRVKEHKKTITSKTYIFSFFRGESNDMRIILIEDDGVYTSKHLLEVFLQARDVLAVANDLQQVLISNKVESAATEFKKRFSNIKEETLKCQIFSQW